MCTRGVLVFEGPRKKQIESEVHLLVKGVFIIYVSGGGAGKLEPDRGKEVWSILGVYTIFLFANSISIFYSLC